MSGTYREFLDSREPFADEPTAEDWAEYERWLDATDDGLRAAEEDREPSRSAA